MANNDNYIKRGHVIYVYKCRRFGMLSNRTELTIKTRYSTSTVYHPGAGIIHALMS